MKKSLIALAVLASTGAAMAQSSVTLYGIADVNLQSSKTTDNPRQNKVESGGINGSRFGLKGSEDLGGGLKALFVLEGGFSIDTGANTAGSLFNRSSYVGLAGSFGEFRIGNVRTAYDDTSINSDSLWDGLLAPAYYAWHQNYVATPGNSLYYATPSFGGVTAAVSYSLGENKTATTGAKGLAAFNVQYSGGPLYLSLAYQVDKKNHDVTFPTALATYNAIALPTAAQTTAIDNASIGSYKDTLLNASYDFGVVKLEGSYSHNVTVADVKANQFQIGVDVPVGPALALSTGYAYSKDKDVAGVTGEKRDGFGLGAKYTLSKRTFVYTGAMFGQTKPAGGGDKSKTDLYTVGINHQF